MPGKRAARWKEAGAASRLGGFGGRPSCGQWASMAARGAGRPWHARMLSKARPQQNSGLPWAGKRPVLVMCGKLGSPGLDTMWGLLDGDRQWPKERAAFEASLGRWVARARRWTTILLV